MFEIKVTCVEGSEGWGQTQTQVIMTIPAKNAEEAKCNARVTIPGGWILHKPIELPDEKLSAGYQTVAAPISDKEFEPIRVFYNKVKNKNV